MTEVEPKKRGAKPPSAAELKAAAKAGAILEVPLSWLTPNPRNTRTHSDEQVGQIARSIERFGFRNPILAGSDGVIDAGHGRRMALEMLGRKTARVLISDGMTPAERRAYVIADNQIALNGGWDQELLKLELGELKADDFDLSLIGFDESQLAGILDVNLGGADPDDVPAAPVKPNTRKGDVWILGRHRIICGDSTDAVTVDRLLAGAKPHLMVTDPPYGVEYDATWRKAAIPKKNPGKTGGMHGKVLNDDRADWREAWALFSGDVAYVWCAPGPLNCKVHDSLVASDLPPKMQIVWSKSHFAIGRSDYHMQHENCWYAVRLGAKSHWNGDRKQSTVWSIAKPHKSDSGHSTQKPVECMQRPIENNSKPGDAIYEPFSGSGTTIIACEVTGRKCYAIELNPVYVDVAVKRWEKFSGGKAKREKL